jgi:hypothetical protein
MILFFNLRKKRLLNRLPDEMKIIKKLLQIASPTEDDIFEVHFSSLKNAEEKPVFEILNIDPKDFPLVQHIGSNTVKRKFKKLKRIMEKHNFILELSEKLPVSEAYRYLTEVFLYENETAQTKGWTCHITGCTGDCPRCFQLEYCELKDEI